MKRKISIIVAVCMLVMFSTSIYAGGAKSEDAKRVTAPTVMINDYAIKFDEDPFISYGVTLAPGRQLLEGLSYAVSWDEEKQALSASKQGRSIVFLVGQDNAIVNHKMQKLPLPVRIVHGEVFIPLRIVAELDERAVKWNSISRTVFITSNEFHRVRISTPIYESSFDDAKQAELAKLIAQIETDSKVQLEWESIPYAYYEDKLKVMIAAGDPPNLAYIPNPAIYPSNLFSSIAWKVGELISDYASLSKLPKQSFEQLKAIDNGVYGIPKLASNVDGIFPVLNQNWLDQLNFSEPTTMDELYAVMQGFTKYDPDGNGKHDTYGLTGNLGTTDLGTLAWVEHVFNENVSRYEYHENKIVDLAVQNGTREALLWLKKAYTESLIDPEAIINTKEKAQQSYIDGKSGIVAMALSEAAKVEQHKMQDKQLAPLVFLKRDSTALPVTGTRLAYDGMYYISNYASNESVLASFSVLNKLYSIANDSEASVDIRKMATEITGSEKINLEAVSEQTKERYKLIEAARGEVDVKELLDARLEAKLENDLRAAKFELDRQLLEKKVKFIIGSLTMEEWDSYVTNLMQDESYIQIMNIFNSK